MCKKFNSKNNIVCHSKMHKLAVDDVVANGSRPNNIVHLLNRELRHLKLSRLEKLSAIIDKAKAWIRLIEELTKPDDGSVKPACRLSLSLDAIKLIEQQTQLGKSPTLALLFHWSIVGRTRPTIRVLLHYLQICDIKRAYDYVCESILGIQIAATAAPDPSSKGLEHVEQPKCVDRIHDDRINYSIEEQFRFENLDRLVDGLSSNCKRYSFDSIYRSTNGFCHEPYNAEHRRGTKIGEGRFSSVYLARAQAEGEDADEQTQVVAVKLLKSDCNDKSLANEINIMRKVDHCNILSLLGISVLSNESRISHICLVYPFIQNGSLLDCLRQGLPTRAMAHLDWLQRIDIAIKVGRGISYLHTFDDKPVIHRDVKTANIFIDSDLQPKVGDFTLVRQLDTAHINDTQYSQNVIGTSVYMPPEAFRGDISIKFDTFSFGIVLLEILTGLKPFDEELDQDLLTLINDKLSDLDDELSGGDEARLRTKDELAIDIADKRAGQWNNEVAAQLFDIALRASESRKRDRPMVSELLGRLESLATLCNLSA